ncbi:MAG: BamA/TamA family outer membrane protein, partial [Calditrichia bacterium]|nr:BamA/TamA family outer membrane protein [Calditrichia bacterium]
DILHSEEDEEFDARLVKLDKILLTNFYRQNGFLTVIVFDSLIINSLTNEVKVIYELVEGQRYYLDRIEFEGNELYSRNALLNSFEGMTPGNPFDEGMMKSAKQGMENLYYNNGKPFVVLSFDYEFESDSMVVIKCTIKENQTVTIKDMEYIGLKLVQTFIIYRELEIKRGEVYSREELALSHRNLYRTGLFEYVRFEIKPTEEDSTQALLVIQLQEKDPAWIGARIGFTYEEEESYGNKIEIALEGGHRNLWGTGRSLSLHVVPSLAYDIESKKAINPDNHISLIFVEPWIGYTKTPGVFMASYHMYRPLNSADFNVLRFNFGVSRELTPIIDLRGSLEAKLVSLLEEGIIDTTLEADANRDQVYSISTYGKRDTRNNFFNPTNGSLSDLSLGYSYSIGELESGGKDIKTYITLISSWKRYQPLKWKPFKKREGMTIATRLKGGAIFEIGPTKNLPISDLFFAGGATTVRGYPEQLLGPTTFDSEGYKNKAIGGKLLYLMNVEIRIPIYWLFVGEIFLDGGNVWREISDFNPTEIKFSTGLGLVLLTPIGPIRFDYG